MKIIIILFLFINAGFFLNAQDYNASIEFSLKNAGSTVDGTLEGFEGELDFDPDNPEASTIRASVDVSTIETGINLRDKHLKVKGYFWSEKYPEITMISREIVKKNDGTFLGRFDLNIKGTTQRVEVPFTYTKLGNTAQYMGSFRIDRMDFNVGNKSLFIDREVMIKIEVKVRG